MIGRSRSLLAGDAARGGAAVRGTGTRRWRGGSATADTAIRDAVVASAVRTAARRRPGCRVSRGRRAVAGPRAPGARRVPHPMPANRDLRERRSIEQPCPARSPGRRRLTSECRWPPRGPIIRTTPWHAPGSKVRSLHLRSLHRRRCSHGPRRSGCRVVRRRAARCAGQLVSVGSQWPKLRQLCLYRVTGNEVPAAWLAACVVHPREHLVGFDRGFRKLPSRGCLRFACVRGAQRRGNASASVEGGALSAQRALPRTRRRGTAPAPARRQAR